MSLTFSSLLTPEQKSKLESAYRSAPFKPINARFMLAKPGSSSRVENSDAVLITAEDMTDVSTIHHELGHVWINENRGKLGSFRSLGIAPTMHATSAYAREAVDLVHDETLAQALDALRTGDYDEFTPDDAKKIRQWGSSLNVKTTDKGRHKALGGLLEYDEEADEADFVVSTEAPDRDGDTVAQESIDWSEFDVNPALTLSHDTETIPAGSWLPETRRTVKVKDPRSGETVMATVMRARFNMNTAGGKELAMSVRDGHMRGASISFLPSDDGTQKNRSGGSHYEGAKVTEIAVCNVPANQGATRAVEMVLKSLRRKAIIWEIYEIASGKILYTGDQAGVSQKWRELEGTGSSASGKYGMRPAGKKSKAPPFQNFEPKLDGDKWGVWNRRANKWESRDRFPDRSSAWNYAEHLYSELLDDEARWGETVSHSIKFWRHKTDKGRVRVMRKDVGAFANEMAIEPLDEEPKAEDLVEWAEEEMQEPEHDKGRSGYDTPGSGGLNNGFSVGSQVQTPDGQTGKIETIQGKEGMVNGKWHDLFQLKPAKSKTDDLADASAERAMQLSDVPADEAVDAAMEEQDVPKAMRPAVKRLALKRLVAKTAEAKDCSDMPGYKYLKGIIDELESKRKGIENEHVTRAADKALDALKAGIVRAYGKDAYPGDQEEVVENELEQVQVDDKWTNYDGTTDEYVGEYDTEEAAKRGVREETDAEVKNKAGAKWNIVNENDGKVTVTRNGTTMGVFRTGAEAMKYIENQMDDGDYYATGAKSKMLRRKANRKTIAKGLSKAASALLKDQTEVLDDLAGGSDLPKRYKGTVAGVSSALKTLLTKDQPEETLLSKEADEEAVLALAKSIEAKADDFDVAMKRKYGQMWSRDKN